MGIADRLARRIRQSVASSVASRLNGSRAFGQRFVRETRGNVAMIFALALPVLVMITLGGIDISRAASVRMNLQDALDAAALTAARSSYVTDADLTREGLKALRANMQPYDGVTLREDKTSFTLTKDQVVIATASADVKTMIANIVMPPYGKILDDVLPVGASAEVNRSSKNIEVALVLDITGSMRGNRITDLKSAANTLVDIVVQPVQTPFYTRMSVVPYSMGVSVGSEAIATAVRGPLLGSTNITGAAWTTGGSSSISGITRASPGVITSNGHGFVTGDYVWISGVRGMTQINDKAYQVVRINNNSYSLRSANGAVSTNGWNNYSNSGIARECLVSDCSIVITSPNHGMPASQIVSTNGATVPSTVRITDVGGMTQINNGLFEIDNVTSDSFSIGVNGANYGNYSWGGKAWCGNDGCQTRVFRNMSNNLVSLPSSTCVSERIGAAAYTDAAPSSARVGRSYTAPGTNGNPCPNNADLLPLSSDRNAIKNLINGLPTTGSTAGQIGLAWGWYSVSPNFNSVLGGVGAAPVRPSETIKSVILMTDGEFNTPYCAGVIARDAGDGSGANADKIACNATNGDPFAQATRLCNAMKADSIVVYTVGFSITPGSAAARILSNCATGPDYAFLPASGADLKEAFTAIGRDITRLRISK